MFREPRITVALTADNGDAEEGDRADAALTIVRNDGGGILNTQRWNLRRLEPHGYHALCQGLGDSLLRLLAAAHPAEFAKYPLLVPPKLDTDDPSGLVLSLINRSYKEKTADYISAIDRIFQQSADHLNETDLPVTWKDIRLNLMQAFPSLPAS